MISKEEEQAFYDIMGTLDGEVEKISEKVENQNKAKLVGFILLMVLGIISMIVSVSLNAVWLGVASFVAMFVGGYFVSKSLNI